MTTLLYVSRLTLIFLPIFLLTSCLQNDRETSTNLTSKPAQFDTSKTTILPFDQQRDYPFSKSYKPATLTQEDVATIDSLFLSSVTTYNNRIDKNHLEYAIDLKKETYRKQLIVATNTRGEKEVWVNCFCDTWGSDKWKTQILVVDDGGPCYFNFKVNLHTKRAYDLFVNGIG